MPSLAEIRAQREGKPPVTSTEPAVANPIEALRASAMEYDKEPQTFSQRLASGFTATKPTSTTGFTSAEPVPGDTLNESVTDYGQGFGKILEEGKKEIARAPNVGLGLLREAGTAGSLAGHAMSPLFKPLEIAAGPIRTAMDEVSNAISKNIPEGTQNTIRNIVTKILQPVADFDTQNPEESHQIKQSFEDIFNMLNLLGVVEAPGAFAKARASLQGLKPGVVAKGAPIVESVKQGLDVVRDTADTIYNAITKNNPEALDAAMRTKFEKGVRPSVSGKSTAPQMEAYMDKAINAVDTITKNKAKLNLLDEYGEKVQGTPRTLKQFADAIDQTKKEIFNQYDSLAKQAGEQGAKVELAPIVEELRTIIENPTVQDLHPELIKYAESKASAFQKRGSYTSTQAQEAITSLNRSLEAFYKNPSFETATKANVDALIVNKLRQSLDAAIESISPETSAARSAAGLPGYQELKNSYGALKAIEKDVVHRSIVDARKNAKGLLDFTDILSGAEAVRGILSSDPATIAGSAFMKTIKEYYKYLNNPNTAIKKLFQASEKKATY